MKLWTIQPLEVVEQIEKIGYYICDSTKAELPNDFETFRNAYTWLSMEMDKRIGRRPKGVVYPVWAWYIRNWKNKKPDLRESGYGPRGEKMVCIEIEKNKKDVLLSDFDAWHSVLNNGYFPNAYNESEWDRLQDWYDSLSIGKQKKVKLSSWENIFDITPFENDFMCQGRYVQATFWVLKKEEIKKIQYFICK